MGKQISKLTILLAISFFIFSCKSDTDKIKDTILDIRMAKQPEKLNPIFFPNPTSREVNQNIFLPLADFDPITYELQPLLIKAIPIAEKVVEGNFKDHLKYTFEILDEAVWDDGKPITGEDYLFTLKAILHPGTSANAYRGIIRNFAGVEIDPKNNKKVSVYYSEYYMLALETVIVIEPLPKHIYDANSVLDKLKFEDLLIEEKAEALVSKDSLLMKFSTEMNSPKYTREIVVGCGPYKLEAWNTDQNIVLTRKENFWAKNKTAEPFIQGPEKIVFHFIPDETAALARLQNKEIDVLTGLNNQSFMQLQKDSSLQYSFHTPQLMKYYAILINHKDPILKSKNVRKAFASIVNVDQYISTFEGGNALRTVGHINPSKKYYNKNIKPYAFDIENGKKYLKDDGWVDSNNNGIVDKKINGKNTELTFDLIYSGELGQNMSLLIKEEAKKIGMNVEIIKKEIGLLRKENLETGKFATVMQSASVDLGLDDLRLRFHSDNAELGEGNYGFFVNTKADSLITAINISENANERNRMYMKLQEIIYDELPYVFLYSPKEKIVTTKKWNTSANAKRPGYQPNTFTSN